MTARFLPWTLALMIGALGLTACEPYMSMTDQIPAQARRAATLLPDQPRYVGMVEVETVVRHLETLGVPGLADSLRATDQPFVRRFLDATGVDPTTDVQAIYGALAGQEKASAVLFATLTPEQLDRYLQQAPDGGRATTYGDVPLYHLALGSDPTADTLVAAFVDRGTWAVALDAGRVSAMVDRHRTGEGGLIGNDAFMALVKRVGRGSTAWFAGRDVLQTALRDSAAASLRAEAAEADDEPKVNHAGIQRALASWSDRVLGLSEVSSPLDGRAGKRFNQLQQRLREQAVSVTLTDAGLDGEVYLTMRDESSASSVVDVAEGAVAMLKLSKKEALDERHRDLLEDVEIERDGAVVRVRFSLDRNLLQKGLRDGPENAASHRIEPSTRPARASIHRLGSISSGPSGFEPARIGDATDPAIRLSTALPRPPTGP